MNEMDLQLLERYLDGEVSSDERAEVEGKLARESEWQAEHASLLAARNALRTHFNQMVEAADFSNLWARVEAELPEGIPMAATPTPMPAVPVAPAAPASMGERFGRWFKAHWPTVLVSAGAAAAVAVAVTRNDNAGPTEKPAPAVAKGETPSKPELKTPTNPPLERATDAPELAPAGQQVVVDGVTNEGPNKVIVNQPEGDAPTVIWIINDEDAGAKKPGANGGPPSGEDPI